MRISPEPLHPLRSWRELWQSQPLSCDRAFRTQTEPETGSWKQQKRSHFQWLSYLFNREMPK